MSLNAPALATRYVSDADVARFIVPLRLFRSPADRVIVITGEFVTDDPLLALRVNIDVGAAMVF